LHVVHQLAQKSRITAVPFKSASRRLWPLNNSRVNVGACVVAAWTAGTTAAATTTSTARTRARRICWDIVIASFRAVVSSTVSQTLCKDFVKGMQAARDTERNMEPYQQRIAGCRME